MSPAKARGEELLLLISCAFYWRLCCVSLPVLAELCDEELGEYGRVSGGFLPLVFCVRF